MKTASLQDRLAEGANPCARRVVPVSTTSAMTSATPSVIAVSTAPSNRTTSA
jgi:hypothetical protein